MEYKGRRDGMEIVKELNKREMKRQERDRGLGRLMLLDVGRR